MKNSNFSRRGANCKFTKIDASISNEMIEFFESLIFYPERWENPWILSEHGLGAHNADTKERYNGVYQIYLSVLCCKNGYTVNRWLTAKQIRRYGARIKAPKGTVLNIFNVCQCEGLPDAFYLPYKRNEADFNPVGNAEEIMKKCGAEIQFSDQTFYNLSFDQISFTQRKKFKNIPTFYNHIFHEIGHWTGHPERLNRYLFYKSKHSSYVFEELTAELCSVFINSVIGIDIKFKHSQGFIERFLNALRCDNIAFVRSAMEAEEAANFIFVAAEMGHLKRQVNENVNQLAA